jgi:hypothetical protein
MSDAIKPPWAPTIWYDSDHIWAELPSVNGHLSHTIKVPFDVQGLTKVLVMAHSRNAGSKLGTKGDPTQHQINKPTYDPAKVRRVREKFRPTPQQSITAREIMRKMGLI